jgi:hypothetical protein
MSTRISKAGGVTDLDKNNHSGLDHKAGIGMRNMRNNNIQTLGFTIRNPKKNKKK